MRKRIKITAIHIKEGIKQNCKFCPLSLAASASFGVPCRTGGVYIGMIYKGEKLIITLPEVARKFILDFDTGKPVDPISFTVEF